MDLRKQKTLRSIREAFYILRRQKNTEQITVTELARKAEISKATFYLHYRDIFDLSEKLQQEVIQTVFSKLEDPMQILTDPTAFMNQMAAAMDEESDAIIALFSGPQISAIPRQLENFLKDYIFTQVPQLKDDPRIPVYLSYHIQGGYHAYVENVERLGYRKVLSLIRELQSMPPKIEGIGKRL